MKLETVFSYTLSILISFIIYFVFSWVSKYSEATYLTIICASSFTWAYLYQKHIAKYF